MKSRLGSVSSSRTQTGLLVATAVFCLIGNTAVAKVFYSQKEALALAFPGATRIESSTYILSDEQVDRVERASRSQLDSRIAKFHLGWQEDHLLGYAFIDVHTVRTLPEAFMVVVDPAGDRPRRLVCGITVVNSPGGIEEILCTGS